MKQDKRLEVEKMTLEEILKKEFERGFEEGLKQARKQQAIEIAKNLLDVLNDETIASATGVDIEEVRQLRLLTMKG
ncbi:MAG: hypothetical protein HFE54_05915 [Turicibacter sp.]|nr:hypothetical protein [Turicibacter sp.]MCI9351466.1 hypothetical protein [Turicibacter sp.]